MISVRSVRNCQLFFFFFVGAVGTFSSSNDQPLPSSVGPTHPQPDGHCFLDSLGASQVQGPRLFDIGGLCFYERPSSVVPGFPSGTTETYVSHIVKRPLVGRKGDRAGNHLAWIRTAMLTQGTRPYILNARYSICAQSLIAPPFGLAIILRSS
uniref:RxLR effector candidate protein n=1 Tax=Hyaloperonospora arabidopsidis (strain Emoy2) TaxID=559515 RepID=M4C0U0_HYAAE